MSAVDVLRVMDSIARDYDVLLPKQAGEVRATRAAVAELIAAATEVADEHMGIVATDTYQDADDEIGCRVCCGVLSYEPHADDCDAVRLRAAIAACKGETP